MFAKKEHTVEEVDLYDAAREVIAMSSTELRRGGAVLETDFAESLPAVSLQGDRNDWFYLPMWRKSPGLTIASRWLNSCWTKSSVMLPHSRSVMNSSLIRRKLF